MQSVGIQSGLSILMALHKRFPSLRPIKPFQQTVSRGLHVLHHMFTKTPDGRITFVKKKPVLPADQVKLHLLDSKGSNLGPMTLTSALPLIKPLTYLAQVEHGSSSQHFQIKPLKFRQPDIPGERKTWMRKFKRSGLGKEFHLTTDTPPSYLSHVLNKACEYLLQGARIQFALHRKHGKGGLSPRIDVALENCPHLRPDTILRAMPEGTTILAHPCIAPEAMKKFKKNPHVEPPLLWAVEHAPSIKRMGVETPDWIKKMATWDVELRLNPEFDNKQKVQNMWKYSVARKEAMTHESTAWSTSRDLDPAVNYRADIWRSKTVDELVP